MPNVLIAAMTLARCDERYRLLLQQAGRNLLFPPKPVQLREHELLEQLAGVHASLVGSEPYTRRVIQANPGLRVIARLGVGFDAVDLDAATQAGVVVTTTPGTNQEAVAEHVFALLLALTKQIVRHHAGTRAGQWPRQINRPLRGSRLGIVGLGRTGKAVARRARAFDMEVLATGAGA